jgi:hypothetical protein
MVASGCIALVEPQMHNLFHSPFNAALLHAVVLAFPEAEVSFRALPGHAAAVRGILCEHAPEIIPRVDWLTIETPSGGSVVSRWRSNRSIFRQVLRPRERVVFCSISRMQLMQLKRMMTPADEVLAVLHGDLDRIAEPEAERFPAGLFALRRVLLTKQPLGLRFVLLGESIRRSIPAEFEAAFANAAVIDHPYHFPAARVASEATNGKPLIFGVFGNSGDGRLLERVARAVASANPDPVLGVVFRLVGFVSDGEAVARLAPLVEGVGDQPLPREEFVRRAESITYSLWLAPAGSFKLRASGTFFDALAYAKPLVYVANAFIDSYHPALAGIAVRCARPEDVAAAILEVASQRDPDEYSRMRAGMTEFRERFTPQALARTLPSKFGW